MNRQLKKLNLVKARRRVKMRSALLLTLAVCCVLTLYRALTPFGGTLPGWALDVLVMLSALGGGAYLGLCVLDGNQKKLLPRGTLSRAQTLWLTLTGVLAVCPATLAADVLSGLLSGAQAAQRSADAAQPVPLFLLTLLKSGLLAPVLEELFFRGYLLHALERCGKGRALAASAICFALVHPAGSGLAMLGVYLPLGLLFGALAMKTGSLLAPVLLHACYNLTLLLAAALGLSGLLGGLTLISCALRLGGCIAFVYCLRRAWLARGTRAQLKMLEGLTRRELAYVAVAAALALIAGILG